MTVLVTGAAGFVGAHVARALMARGDAVIGMDDLNDYYSPQLKRDRVAALCPNLRLIVADLADPDWPSALADTEIDHVVHCAAQAGVRHSIDHPHAYARSNLVGQLNVLEFARARRVRHLIYTSSSSVYGGNEPAPSRVEDRVDRPMSLYAATKRAGELMGESYAHLFRLPQTGLRLFTVYGPWGRPDMAPWIFTRAILTGQPVQVFNQGRMQRDFTWVGDIVAGIVAALDRPPVDDGAVKPGGSVGPHAIYNLGNHRPETLGRFIDLIEQACGRSAIRDPQPMQPGDVPATWADIAPAVQDLGFAPAMMLEEGVPLFVRWYRDYTGL